MISQANHELLDHLLNHAIDLSIRHVDRGGLPFTALVVDGHGRILGTGVNEVAALSDPTAHAEVMAIRNACQCQHTTRLNGATLIASGEPCALCYLAALWVGIGQVVFAADRHAAAKAGFDYRGSYALFAVDPINGPLRVHHHCTYRACEPFNLWLEQRAKTGRSP
ncbi:nucleoside deaminase [Microvirga sp. 3-52]|nr:nucleoside deaminase [Microvirga sp. 3-52]